MSINTIYRVHNSSSNLHNGGLKYNCHYDNQGSVRAALTIPTSGKWYWEVRLLTSNSNATFGICPSNYSMTENPLSSSKLLIQVLYVTQHIVNILEMELTLVVWEVGVLPIRLHLLSIWMKRKLLFIKIILHK